jgi:hypothetical protein
MVTKKLALWAGSALVAGSMLAAIPANAAIVLTFEGAGDEASINDFYNGGTDSQGNSGTNYGISFTSDSLAIIATTSGGTGNFSNAPSGDTVAFFLNGSGDTMNVAAGFDTGFSFFYADQVGFTGSVDVYSGLNGTGSILAHLSLPSTPNPYTVFVPIGVNFAGTAQSVVFGGAANFIAFDDITIGSATAGGGTPTPEPMTLSLFGAGLAGLAARRKRKSA